MKYILVIFFVIGVTNTYSQNNSASWWKNRCDFVTDGSGKSLGLKLKLSFPCAWQKLNGERPHIVKKFSYGSNDNSTVSTLTINQLPATPTKAEVEEMFSQAGMKELCDGLGTFLSGRKVKIDGEDCAEVEFKMTREHSIGTLYLYNLHYYFVYKDKMIVLAYAVGSTDDKKSKLAFDNYKTLFRGLAGNTVFLSKWAK